MTDLLKYQNQLEIKEGSSEIPNLIGNELTEL